MAVKKHTIQNGESTMFIKVKENILKKNTLNRLFSINDKKKSNVRAASIYSDYWKGFLNSLSGVWCRELKKQVLDFMSNINVTIRGVEKVSRLMIYLPSEKWTMNKTLIFFKIRGVSKQKGAKAVFTKREMNNE